MLSRLFKHESDRVKSTELVEFATVQDQLNHWTIPLVHPEIIYRYGMFEFKSNMTIKIMERTESIEDNDKIINLMEPRDLITHMRNYKYVHLGLVQVAF